MALLRTSLPEPVPKAINFTPFSDFAFAPLVSKFCHIINLFMISTGLRSTFCSFFLIKKNQKIKAAEYFGVHVLKLAHAIQLARFTRSDSIAYRRPSQQASKHSLFPKMF